MRLLLAEGTICTFDRDQRVISPGMIGIQDGLIQFVGESVLPDFVPDKTLHCAGDFILPGFINAHVHLGEHLLRGWMDERNFERLFYSRLFTWESALDPASVYCASLAAAAEALLGGTTTVVDMYHHAEATARAVQEIGIRACIGQKILGFSLKRPPQLTASGINYHFDQGAFRAQLEAACHFADEWHAAADGRITTALAPHATNTLTRSMLEEVAEAANNRSTLIHMHLAQTESEFEEVRSREGVGCVELLAQAGILQNRLIGAHAIFLAPDEEFLLSSHHAAVAHNPIANAKDAGLIAPIPRLRDAGVHIGLGTDAFRMDLLEAARFAACLHRTHAQDPTAFLAHDVLVWATSGGAAAIGMEDRIGSLEPGKQADIVVIDGSQIHSLSSGDPYTTVLYYGGTNTIRTVLVNGQIVVEQGNLVTLGIEEIRRQFEAAVRAFLRRW